MTDEEINEFICREKNEGYCPCCNGEKSKLVTYRGGPKDGMVILEHLGSSTTGKGIPIVSGRNVTFAWYKKISETEMIYECSHIHKDVLNREI